MKFKKPYLVGVCSLLLLLSLAVFARQFYRDHFGEAPAPKLPELKEEYRKLVDRFLSAGDATNVSGLIRLYDGENPQTVRETQPFRYWKGEHNAFYSALGPQQTISDGHLALLLDTANQLIIVSKVPDTASHATHLLPLGQLPVDTLLTGLSGSVSEDGDTRSLTFSNDAVPEVNSYRVFYNKTSYQLERAEIRWWKNGTAVLDSTKKDQVWITRIEYAFGKEPPLDISGIMEKIVKVEGSKILPASAYSRYEIRTGN